MSLTRGIKPEVAEVVETLAADLAAHGYQLARRNLAYLRVRVNGVEVSVEVQEGTRQRSLCSRKEPVTEVRVSPPGLGRMVSYRTDRSGWCSRVRARLDALTQEKAS